MLSSVAVSWAWNLPMAIVVVRWMGMGAVGAWFVLTMELVLLSVVTGLRVRSGRWLEVGAAMVEAEAEEARRLEAEAA